MRKLAFLVSFCAIPACAGNIFSIGVTGGVPFNDVVTAGTHNSFDYISKSTNYTVGPSFQINLPLNLRFEFDALYRPYNFVGTSTISAPFATAPAPSDVSANQWAFPMLAQYRFKLPVVSPFVEAGLSVDHLSNVAIVGSNFTSGPGALVRQTNAGVVIGGGVDLKLPIVRISGELRYTRQGEPYFASVSNLNEAEFLVGIHF